MRKFLGSLLLTCGLALLPLTAFADDVVLTNPLGITDARLLVIRILRYSLGLLGIIALIMVIYGGFLMLTSGGNADMVKRAKSTLIWAAAGIAIILGSWTILSYIFTTFNSVAS